MGESDNDSWSVVDEDESMGDRSAAAGARQRLNESNTGLDSSTEGPLLTASTERSSGSRGNDSPARPVVLEAVECSSPKSVWDPPSEALPPLPEHNAAASSTYPTSLDNGSAPSLATEVTPDSYFLAQSTRTPFDLGLPSDSPFNSDDFEGDAMSETSTDTHIVVPHPGSDEEDSAERRWRLAEQRGNDIRRARSVPSPRFQGTSSFLNVIVVGEIGLGKTTFIQNLHAALQPDAPAPPMRAEPNAAHEVFDTNPDLLSTEVIIQNGHVRCHYLLQDTPGLNYCQPNTQILDHITAKNAAYLACEQDPQRRVPMSAVEDMRVDACLFFINPNNLKAEELSAMAKLAELVPIVPMIAKADTFMPSELAAFRQHVQQRLAEEAEKLNRHIMWTPSNEDDEEAEGSAEGRAEGSAGPPFAVIASRRTDLSVGRFWPVRDYPWGRCETLSSVNSDISLLKQLLFEDGFAELKQATEERYYRFREGRLRAANIQDAAGDKDPLEVPDVARVDNQARQPNPPRHGANRGPQGRTGYRKLWKVGLVLLTTVTTLTMAFNYGKMAGTRQLQQDLAASRELADMKDQVVSGLASSLSIINKQHASQLRAAQAQLHAMHSPVKGFDLESYLQCEKDLESDIASQEEEVTRIPTFTAMVRRDDGFSSLELSSVVCEDIKPVTFSQSASMPIWLNKQHNQVKQGRSHQNWPMLYANPLQDLFAQQKVNISRQADVPNSSQALQNVTAADPSSKLTRFAHLNGTARSKAWLALCQHYTTHHPGPHILEQSKALVTAGHHAAHSIQSMTQHAGVVLYNAVRQPSAAIMRRLADANAVVVHAQEATVAAVRGFGKDVAEAGRMTVRDTPVVLRKMRGDADAAAKHSRLALKHAGLKLKHGAQHTFHQVQISAMHAKKKAQGVMRDVKKLGSFKRPKLGKTAKFCLRILAQVGVLGAAL